MLAVDTVLECAVAFLAHLTTHTRLFALAGEKPGDRHIRLQGQEQGDSLAGSRPSASLHFP